MTRRGPERRGLRGAGLPSLPDAGAGSDVQRARLRLALGPAPADRGRGSRWRIAAIDRFGEQRVVG